MRGTVKGRERERRERERERERERGVRGREKDEYENREGREKSPIVCLQDMSTFCGLDINFFNIRKINC